MDEFDSVFEQSRRPNNPKFMENLQSAVSAIRYYWGQLFRSKDLPRGNKKPFNDSFTTRRSALNHARRRLERTYGMKGESSFNAEQLDELRQIFEFYDIDSSKTMDLSELNMALSALGYNASENDVHDLAALMDVDGDMTMDFSEFCMIVEYLKEEKGLEAELRDAFLCIDTNGSGFVTADELLDLLMTQGNTMSLKEASELIRFVDKNADGELNYEEFMRVILEGRNLSRSTTLYSTAPSSINSFKSGCSSRHNVGRATSMEEVSASFKTAVSSNTNGTIADIAETVQMSPLSPKLRSLGRSDEKISATDADDRTKLGQASNSLELTSLSQEDETLQPTSFNVAAKTDVAEQGGNDSSTQKNLSGRQRPKLRRSTREKESSIAIKVVGPSSGDILGSVVLENPRTEEE